MKFDVQPLGDLGIRVGFPQVISPEVNRMIRAFSWLLEKEAIPGIREVVPTYTALSIYYDPMVISYGEMAAQLQMLQKKIGEVSLPPARRVEIPVLYGGEAGPDLHYVATYHRLTEEEVVHLHSEKPYLVYMIGFAPGFPYLGGLSELLSTPRLTNPRARIPGGSVGIGGSQTGIYSIDAPGGWQIIGHTPIRLYDPTEAEPILLKAGDFAQFVPVAWDEYREIREQVERRTYEPHICQVEEVEG